MSDGPMSQEEIDALMAGASADDSAEEAAPAPDPAPEAEAAPEPAPLADEDDVLDPSERDTLGEIGNICMSSAATALSTLLSRPVQITTPTVSMTTEAEIRGEYSGPAVVVVIEYTEGLDGRNVFVLTSRDASIVADLMMGGEGTPSESIDEMHASAIGEAMNQMMGSAATAMAQMVGRRTDISAPVVSVVDVEDEAILAGALIDDGPLVRTAFELSVGDLLDTRLMQIMPVPFARALVAGLNGADAAAPAAEPAPAMAEAAATAAPPAPPADDRHLHAVQVPVAQPVAFPSLDEMPPMPGGSDISMLLDVPLQVTVELGRTQLRIRDVLELVPGSIIELDRLAGEPVDVLVNGKQIARGEVVVIDEEFGVRISDVASQAKRLRGLALDES